MAITALPTPPSRQDPTNFPTRADAFMAALPTFATEATALQVDVNAKQVAAAASQAAAATSETNAAASAATAVNAPGTSATSVTSLTIASSGSVSLTLAQTGKAFSVGQSVVLAMTATPTTWMTGVITAFTAGTGVMTVSLAMASGSGTASAWTISLTSPALGNGTVTPAKLSTGGPTWDANSNLGIGAAPSAWQTGYTAFDFGSYGSLWYSTGSVGLHDNAYVNGGAWKYKFSDLASGYQQTGGMHQWFTAPSGTAGNAITFTQSMTLNGSGSLGVSVIPSAWGGSMKAIELPPGGSFASAGGALGVTANAWHNGTSYIYKLNGTAVNYVLNSLGGHQWYIAPSGTSGNAITFTQAMTLTSGGALLVNVANAGYQNANSQSLEGNAGYGVLNHAVGTSSGTLYLGFGYNGAGIGSITQNGTTSVAYNTSSDYRLKTDIQPMTGALASVMALRPVTYTWRSDGSDGEGFIAHELAEVCPAAVTGEKDATRIEQYEAEPAVPAVLDADGNELTPAIPAVMAEREVPVYQGIDTSFLVGRLVAAIQEQQAQIEQLKTDFEALLRNKAAHG